MKRLVLGLTLAGVAACAATPTGPLNPDLFTVSGRYALPRADTARFAGSLRVSGVELAHGLEAFDYDAIEFDQTVTAAIGKSLDNYGYGGNESDARVDLDVRLSPIEIDRTDEAITAHVSLDFQPTDSDPSLQCAAYTSNAQFHALTPVHSGGGQRAVGVIAGIGLAFVGVDASTFVVDQFTNASQNNAAINAELGHARGEGVAPHGEQAAIRFASTYAIQLAIADYIAHLGACDGADTRPL
ncbi:hypothetical protein [Maricaulis sp.]|uniref:hypothetical protein n=1 Tax=Maricaulis sp. TaxID=1486257 RepID=UPI003A9188B2